jgi:RimJ/RimL family protein N-acetyltransferase
MARMSTGAEDQAGTLAVTRMEPDSWVRLRRTRLAALADAPEMFGSTLAREREFDEAEWRRRADRPATFVASRDGADIGIAGVYEIDGQWCVAGMWIVRAARGTGVVEALLAVCESVAQEAGVSTVRLGVMEDNPRGRRAYVRLGYQLTGEREHVRDGRHELFMTKDLREA